MLNRLTGILIFWGFTHFGEIINYGDLTARVDTAMQGSEMVVLGEALAVGFIMVVLAVIMSMFQYYPLMYAVVRIFYVLSRYAICALALISVLHWLASGQDMWAALGAGAAAPFIVFAASLAGIRVYDFNYPLQNRIAEIAAVVFLSLLIIKGAVFLGM